MSVETFKNFGDCKMTIDELRRLVRHGSPGEWRIYFTGVGLPDKPGQVWQVAYELQAAGYLNLVQRRIEHAEPPRLIGKFDYIAKRTSKPWVEPERAARTRMLLAS